MRCGIPKAYILDTTRYKMLMSFSSYCTIGIPNSKTFTGTYERDYTYILLLITKYACKLENVKTLKTMR